MHKVPDRADMVLTLFHATTRPQRLSTLEPTAPVPGSSLAGISMAYLNALYAFGRQPIPMPSHRRTARRP
jgi:hypothetical protein